jgi:hypothetical protein
MPLQEYYCKGSGFGSDYANPIEWRSSRVDAPARPIATHFADNSKSDERLAECFAAAEARRQERIELWRREREERYAEYERLFRLMDYSQQICTPPADELLTQHAAAILQKMRQS